MDSIVEENGNSSNNIDDTNTSGTGGGGVGHNLTITASQQNPQQHPSQQQQQPAAVQSTQQQINLTNSNSQNIAPPPQNQIPVPASVAAAVAAGTVLTTTSNVVQYLSNNPHGLPVQSVIQAANQSSVIQTAAGNNTQTPVAIPKGLLYVNKPNTTVIHTTSGNAVQLPPHFQCKIKPEPNTHHLDTNSEDSFTDEDSPRGRRELTRRPSYNKIYSEISGPDISDNNVIAEDQTRKREIRLQKNREAARECRRKKKEYIKCLENRVAVLENQNKALIEELKSLKELYCQTKND
ncbi:cyclic AMP response element-binding protein B isoform X3 [Lucilia cuprina]|uniref:cyclic AMP response element-binding protein B isoform X3 n=1 Tax=Lucilia cuprina TaxID=7375 RepID=UPI001F06BB2C|nr:cyclic AMP response element-binding protein B isoform X3 [Lucilia cuprina]